MGPAFITTPHPYYAPYLYPLCVDIMPSLSNCFGLHTYKLAFQPLYISSPTHPTPVNIYMLATTHHYDVSLCLFLVTRQCIRVSYTLPTLTLLSTPITIVGVCVYHISCLHSIYTYIYSRRVCVYHTPHLHPLYTYVGVECR